MWSEDTLLAKIFTVIISTIIFGSIAFGAYKYEENQRAFLETLWNNGYCIECQAHGIPSEYRIASSYNIGNSSSPHYIYECPTCGHTVETRELMK